MSLQDVFAQETSSKKPLESDIQASLKEMTVKVEETHHSLTMLEMSLKEKSERLLKYRKEVGKMVSALLEFARPSIQKMLIFSVPSDYTHLSILLESLTQKTQEAIFDLRQEISEINYLIFLRQKQLTKFNEAKRKLEIQKMKVRAHQSASQKNLLPPVSKKPKILKLPSKKNSKKHKSKKR